MDEFTRCSVGARTPLIGEQVTVMQKGRREATLLRLMQLFNGN